MGDFAREIAEGLDEIPLSDWITLVVVLVVAAVAAYMLRSPHFYGGRWPDYTLTAYRSRYAPGTYGAGIERKLRSDSFHRTWSYVGAVALVGLGVLTLLGASRTNDIVVFIVAVLLFGVALLVARDTRGGVAYNSNAHFGGMVLAGTAAWLALTVPALMTAGWFAACIALAVVAIVALGAGRG